MTDVVAILRQIPRFANLQADEITLHRLGGLTNENWKVDHHGESLVLRLPGAGTNDYIDRSNEEINARAAASAGVGADILFCDGHSGLMLARFIPNTVTMSPALFKQRTGSPARAALALKRMHSSSQRFSKRFELFTMIEDYKALLAKLGAELPEGYDEVVAQARGVREVLDAAPVELAPCHCDPLCENFLDDGQRMWIVDWEYSGMNDPWWDLGDLSVEGQFDPTQDREMLEAYCGGPPPAWAVGRMVIYKAMCDLLWTLWGLIQHANKNPVDDFWTYGMNRFARCKALMADPSFAQHLAAIGGRV